MFEVSRSDVLVVGAMILEWVSGRELKMFPFKRMLRDRREIVPRKQQLQD
jgi:hypothetical protein